LSPALEHAPAGIYDIVEDEPPTTEEINAAMAKAVGRLRLRSLPDFLGRMTNGARYPVGDEPEPARLEPPVQGRHRLGCAL